MSVALSVSEATSCSSVSKKTRVPSSEAPATKSTSKAPLPLIAPADMRVVTPLKRW